LGEEEESKNGWNIESFALGDYFMEQEKNDMKRLCTKILTLILILTSFVGCGKEIKELRLEDGPINIDGGTSEAISEDDIWNVEPIPEARQNFMAPGEPKENESAIPIRTIEDLKNISDISKDSYILMNDIDAEGKAINIVAFSGNFDGNYHKIKNTSGPIFSSLNGTVSNLAVIDTTSSSAGIAGELWSGSITNCYVTGEIGKDADRQYTGGIVAKVFAANSYITYCYNLADVYGDGRSSGGIVGILKNNTIGSTSFEIRGCENYGTVTNSDGNGIAGICGEIKFESLGSMFGATESTLGRISGCINYGKVERTGTPSSMAVGIGIGGILGRGYVKSDIQNASVDLRINGCANHGQILKNEKCRSPIGGICGNISIDRRDYAKAFAYLQDCLNTSGDIVGMCDRIESDGGTVKIFRCINLGKSDYPFYGAIHNDQGYILTEDSYFLSKTADTIKNDVKGLTPEQMRKMETFIDDGFDFIYLWEIDDGINNGYPYIRNYERIMEGGVGLSGDEEEY